MKTPALFFTFALALSACTSTTKTESITYDAQGEPVVTQTTVVKSNDAAEAVKEFGSEVKEGVVSGYEWTKEKTVGGYRWVKKKSVQTYDALTK